MYVKFLLSYAFWCFGLMNACYNSRKLARIQAFIYLRIQAFIYLLIVLYLCVSCFVLASQLRANNLFSTSYPYSILIAIQFGLSKTVNWQELSLKKKYFLRQNNRLKKYIGHNFLRRLLIITVLKSTNNRLRKFLLSICLLILNRHKKCFVFNDVAYNDDLKSL